MAPQPKERQTPSGAVDAPTHHHRRTASVVAGTDEDIPCD